MPIPQAASVTAQIGTFNKEKVIETKDWRTLLVTDNNLVALTKMQMHPIDRLVHSMEKILDHNVIKIFGLLRYCAL